MKRLYRTRTVPARLAVLMAVTAALVATVDVHAGAGGSRDATLLRMYQPVLVLHPDELFQPTKIQGFVSDSDLERFSGTSTAQLPLDRYWTVVDSRPEPGDLPAVSPGVFYRLNQTGCNAEAPFAGSACYAD